LADERDEIRERIDIVDLVGQRVALKRAGKNWKGLCPFHDDRNPSFIVSPHLGRYRCWACGEHGDVFTWVMKTQNVEFTEALQILARQAGITLTRQKGENKSQRLVRQGAMEEALGFFRRELERSEAARSYCERRGLLADVLEEWELGYAPDVGDALASHLQRKGFSLSECKSLFLVDEDSSGGYFDRFRGRLIFPIRDERGDLVAFGGRLLGDGHPKYINSSDTPLYRKSRVLYGMNRAKEQIAKERRAVLVEGYLDVIACHRAGLNVAIASLGTSLSEEHARLLKRWCEKVVILYDSDAAGEKAAERAVEVLGAEGLRVQVALMPEGEDPDTLLRTQGPDAVVRAAEHSLSPIENRVVSLRKRLDPAEDAFWIEAVAILADAPTDLELQRFVEVLAPLYPGIKDQVAAQRALKSQALKQRRAGRQSASQARPAVGASAQVLNSPLHQAEATVFRALLDERYREQAWRACLEPEIFGTALGHEVASAIRDAFPADPPKGEPRLWLSQIQPEEVRERLAELELGQELHPVATIMAVITRLRKSHEQRQVRTLKEASSGDDALRDYMIRLRQTKED
jgi:DNA primase